MRIKDTKAPANSMVVKRKTNRTRKPARRARTKTRKPKYLSLRLQFLSTEKAEQSTDRMPSSTTSSTNSRQQQQLNLENSIEEKDSSLAHDQETNMAYLFSAADGGATTLTGLLGAATTSSSDEDYNKTATHSSELSQSASLKYAYRGHDCEEVALVRTALRNKERNSSEERYVRYSQVVEERRDEEVTSSNADHLLLRCRNQAMKLQSLALKLDYEEILNAWSDKGPLYIHHPEESPQTVPDILAQQISSNGLSDGWGNHGSLWRVPELVTSKGDDGELTIKQEQQVLGEEWKLGQREASVLRYKEKRQNRLFSKRIRYEVRKLNAEKRPRIKGRFVKRS